MGGGAIQRRTRRQAGVSVIRVLRHGSVRDRPCDWRPYPEAATVPDLPLPLSLSLSLPLSLPLETTDSAPTEVELGVLSRCAWWG
jgi:hypothetical protein